MSLEQAAVRAQYSLATLSRIENGRRHVTEADVAVLMAAYRAPRQERDALVGQARDVGQEGIWQSADCLDCLTVLEVASRITEWSHNSVPLLLESPAAVRLRAAGARPGAVDRYLRERERVVARVDYTAYLHEAALAVIGGGQRADLADAADRGIGVRVVRGRVGLPAHPWLLVEFPDDPPVVHLRLQRIGVYLHGGEAAAHQDVRDRLGSAACTSVESQRLLTVTRPNGRSAAAVGSSS